MSAANELLNSLAVDEAVMYTANPGTEPHIVIGEDRYITVPEELKRIAVQFDHDIETVTFDCPRYWDEHDMSLMKIYIHYKRPDGEIGCYTAYNVVIDENDDTIMHFNWTLSRHVTSLVGAIKFSVCIRNINEDGTEINHWNSEINSDMHISEGLECDGSIPAWFPTQEKYVKYEEDGDFTVIPDEGYALSRVLVTVDVPSEIEFAVPDPTKPIRFYDTDGTLLYSYTYEEAQDLTALPEPPTNEDILYPMWNYTLEDVQALSTEANIGVCMTDYVTRLHISIPDAGRTDITLLLYQPSANGAQVNFGDGTTYYKSSVSGNMSVNHTYSSPGDYVITIIEGYEGAGVRLGHGDGPCIESSGNNVARRWLRKAYIGSDIGVNAYAFKDCRLDALVFETGREEISGVAGINVNAFANIIGLKHVTLPRDVTVVSVGAFEECHDLRSVSLPPYTAGLWSRAFYNNYSLENIALPTGVNTIESFVFQKCAALRSVNLPNGIAGISEGTFAESGITGIAIPSTVTAIVDGAFHGCNGLTKVVLPDAIISIGKAAFYECSNLTMINIPDGVDITNEALFNSCYALRTIDFSTHTSVPSFSEAASANAFANIADDCQFLVPSALYEEWRLTGFWGNFADRLVAV